MMPTTGILGIALAVAAAGAGVQTVRLAREQAAHAETIAEQARIGRQALEQAVADRDAAQARADTAAKAFEAWKRQQATRVATVKQEVRNAQADSVCRDQPLPDGLRDALRRAPEATGARDAGEPGSVPGVGPR